MYLITRDMLNGLRDILISLFAELQKIKVAILIIFVLLLIITAVYFVSTMRKEEK